MTSLWAGRAIPFWPQRPGVLAGDCLVLGLWSCLFFHLRFLSFVRVTLPPASLSPATETPPSGPPPPSWSSPSVSPRGPTVVHHGTSPLSLTLAAAPDCMSSCAPSVSDIQASPSNASRHPLRTEATLLPLSLSGSCITVDRLSLLRKYLKRDPKIVRSRQAKFWKLVECFSS